MASQVLGNMGDTEKMKDAIQRFRFAAQCVILVAYQLHGRKILHIRRTERWIRHAIYDT